MKESDKTFVTTLRTTATKAATILRWARLQGIEPHSKNELLELAIDYTVNAITKQDQSLAVTGIEEATILLNASGFTSKRNRKTLLLALQDENPTGFCEIEAQKALQLLMEDNSE